MFEGTVQDLLDAAGTPSDLGSVAHRSAEISALCQIAGTPEMAEALVRQPGVSIQKVRQLLLKRRADAFTAKSADGLDVELESQFLPAAEQSPGSGRLRAAVDRLLKRTSRKAKA